MMDMCSQIELTSSARAAASVRPRAAAGGCILVIDDEELILSATARVLHRMGYEAVSFTAPREALAAFEQSPGSFDAIVSDFQMPEINGLQLCEQFVALRGDVPIMLTSAFTDEIDMVRAKEIGIQQVLPKPVFAEELAAWLASVIPQHPPEGERQDH